MASLTQTSLQGMRWSAGAQLAGQIAQYGSFILLTRLLAPADFGTVASATIAIGLAALLNELGLGAALIQRAELTRGHLNACFFANMAAGLLLWGTLAAAAPAVAGFFANPAVGPVLVALGASFPLVGLAVVSKSLLERGLRFRAIATVEVVGALAYAAVSCTLALSGGGVWSLVWGTLAMYAAQLVLYAGLGGFRPGLAFRWIELRELMGFGLGVLGTRLVGYVNNNVDYLLIGKLLGPAALGAYTLAYKLVTWPMLKISHAALRVAFPAFARRQDDPEALRANYLRLVSTLSLVILPLLGGLFALAPQVVPLVFGAQWAEAVLPVQVLCVAGALKGMVCSIGTVFMSKGRPDLEFKLNLVATVVMGISLAIGARWGVAGVAMGVVASSLINAPLQQHVANRLLGLSWRAYLGALAAPATAALAMSAALIAWRYGAAGLPTWLGLLGALPVAAASYLGVVSTMGLDWRKVARQVLGRPRTQPT